MTYRRPPSPTSAVDALARTMGRLRGEELRTPLAGGTTTTEVYAGAVLADDTAQQVISTPWRARTGGVWFDVLATIVEEDGRLLVGIQSTLIANGDEGFSGGMAFQGGTQGPGAGGWSTLDVLCYVGSTLVATVALTSTTKTKRQLLNVPVPENGQISYKIQVDSGTSIVEPGGCTNVFAEFRRDADQAINTADTWETFIHTVTDVCPSGAFTFDSGETPSYMQCEEAADYLVVASLRYDTDGVLNAPLCGVRVDRYDDNSGLTQHVLRRIESGNTAEDYVVQASRVVSLAVGDQLSMSGYCSDATRSIVGGETSASTAGQPVQSFLQVVKVACCGTPHTYETVT